VLPTHRRRGIATALIERFLDDAHARGEVLALLDARGGGLYGRFGFGPGSWCATYRAELGGTSGPVEAAVGLVSFSEVEGALAEVFELARRSAPGEVSRTPGALAALVAAGEAAVGRVVAVHAPEGLIDAYAIYRSEAGEGEQVARLDELVATTDAGYRALWGLLLGLDGPRALITGARPVDEAARFVTPDPTALRTTAVRDRSWLRVLDAQVALSLRRYGGPGGVRIAIHDRCCPWNEATYELEAGEDGGGLALPTQRPAELELEAQDLAAIYLGATRVGTLARAGRVRELAPGATGRADTLFGSAEAPFQTAEL
jgi:predicted acetyltransferase